jgi:hypothetical protein
LHWVVELPLLPLDASLPIPNGYLTVGLSSLKISLSDLRPLDKCNSLFSIYFSLFRIDRSLCVDIYLSFFAYQVISKLTLHLLKY